MPLYDFRCRACGHQFEAVVRPPASAVCRSCGGGDLERMPSSFAVASRDRTRAHAEAARKRAAAGASRDNIAKEREMEKHRREDH